jgi:hypothetical protein
MQQLFFDGFGGVLLSAGDNAGSSLAASSLDDTTRYQACPFYTNNRNVD